MKVSRPVSQFGVSCKSQVRLSLRVSQSLDLHAHMDGTSTGSAAQAIHIACQLNPRGLYDTNTSGHKLVVYKSALS